MVSDTQASELGAILALEDSTASKRWGVRMMKENGVYVLKVQYNNGGGLQYPATLLEDFKLDEWYVLLLTAGGSQFHAQAWERDDPAAAGRYTCGTGCGLPSASSWHFKQWSYAAALWLDEYSEGKVYSFSTTEHASSTVSKESVFADYDDLAIRWSRPVAETSYTFEGDASWVGVRTVSGYEESDQNGSQYGNLTRSSESYWDGSTWMNYRLSRTRFYPNSSNGKYLVGLPASSETLRLPGRDVRPGHGRPAERQLEPV